MSTCAISGAVGTFANVDPRVEAMVAERLGMRVEPVSSQVIPRDRHAMYFAALGVVASSVERLATEIRHLAHRGAGGGGGFRQGAEGVLGDAHKRNPVLTENLTGLARLVRSAVIPALEMWRCGMSATSRTPRSSAALRPMRRFISTSRSAGSPMW